MLKMQRLHHNIDTGTVVHCRLGCDVMHLRKSNVSGLRVLRSFLYVAHKPLDVNINIHEQMFRVGSRTVKLKQVTHCHVPTYLRSCINLHDRLQQIQMNL